MKPTFKYALRRIIDIVGGIGFIIWGCLGRSVGSVPFTAWRRVVVIGLGLLLLYIGAMYYFPSNRRRREELEQD